MAQWESRHDDILAALLDLHQDQAFTDFTIHLKEGPVRVSKLLIAALSPVFRNMLTAGMTESKTNSVHMDYMTTETWTCIIEFYFGSQKLVTNDNMVDVLEVSHMYQLDKLTQYCCDYMQSVCSPDNCLAIRSIAAKLQIHFLVEKAERTIIKKFSDVAKSAGFLSLEKSELLELLENIELVTTEDDVCEALLAWMEDKGADEDTCTEVFQHVRVVKVSNDFLEKVVLHPSMSGISAIQTKVRNELAERLNCGQKQSRGFQQRRRIPDVDGILVVVGEKSQEDLCVYQFAPPTKSWTDFPGPNIKDFFCASGASSDGTIFVTAQHEDFKTTQTSLFIFHNGNWSAGANLVPSRKWHGMEVIQDRVFVVGGLVNESDHLNDVEEYSQKTGQWIHAGDLTFATSRCGVIAIEDTILVAGGGRGELRSLIQTFNVQTKTATVLDTELPRPMHHVWAARLGNTAFFVGSEGDLVHIIEVEGKFQMPIYVQLQDFEESTWVGLNVTDTCVRVFGGIDQSLVCWNHQGQRLRNDKVGDLPEEGIRVFGVHEVD